MRTLSTILIVCLLTFLFAGTLPAQWVQTDGPAGEYHYGQSFAVLDTNLFVLEDRDWGTDIYTSSDYGISWAVAGDVPHSYEGVSSPGLVICGRYLFFGMRAALMAPGAGGVFRSTDNGTTWNRFKCDSVESNVLALTSFGSPGDENLYASIITHHSENDSFSFGVYRSTDDGDNWTKMSSQRVDVFGSSGANLFAGTADGGVFRTTDHGSSWTVVNTGLTDSIVSCFAANTEGMFAGTAHGVFRTTDTGASWFATGFTSAVRAIAVSGNNLFVGTDSGVFLSTNNGVDWTMVNDGLTETGINAFAVHGSYLFVCAGPGHVWRRPLSEMITDVQPLQREIPSKYTLSQNYPNPFNPSTTISYQLQRQGQVMLKVFDVLGREVATLVNGVEDPGYKSVTFDANRLSSGVYYYRLQAGNYVETKRLVLIR